MRKTFVAFAALGLLAPAVASAEPFSVKSGSINVGCASDGDASVEFNAPSGKRIVSVNARWIDQHNIKASSANVSTNTGSKVVATGSIRGLDKEPVGPIQGVNCPGGGHATLEIFGEYK